MERIPETEWVWHGFAAHFIGAKNCRFHMVTAIGKWVVSTVGCYMPEGADEAQDIGCDRKYETFVFESEGICECGCGQPEIGGMEVNGTGSNNAQSAREQHMMMCDHVAKGLAQQPFESA